MICGITTCLRENANYLPDTVDGLTQSGFWCYVCYDNGERSIVETWRRTVQILLKTSVKRIVVFQDDIAVCRNLSRYVSEVELPDDYGVLSLYRPSHYDSGPDDSGFIPAPDQQNTWGACALLMEREIADHIVEHPQLQGDRYLDRCIGRAVADMGLKTYYCVPSLVQHAGEISTISHNQGGACGRRAAADFVGAEFDAADLLFDRTPAESLK